MSGHGGQATDGNSRAMARPRFDAVQGQSFRFGEHVALPATRRLLFRGVPVQLGDRAFDLLVTLLSASGNIVSKDQIIRSVWPTTTVDDSNLRFQMGRLRKALGSDRDRIRTVTGRGYLFAADADVVSGTEAAGSGRPELPAAAEAAPPQATPPQAGPARPTILVIDQDPASRETVRRLFHSLDVTIAVFASVQALLGSGTIVGAARVDRHVPHQWGRGPVSRAGHRRPHPRRDRHGASSC